MIGNLQVYDHKVNFGTSSEQHRDIKNFITSTLSNKLGEQNIPRMDVFNIGGESHTFNAGGGDRHIIFMNGGMTSESSAETKALKFDNVAEFEASVLPAVISTTGNIIDIKDQNGHIVAQYLVDKQELYVLFDAFFDYGIRNKRIFHAIIDSWYEIHWKQVLLRNSWLHSQDKEGLTRRFSTRIERQQENEIIALKGRVNTYEEEVVSRRRSLKQTYDNLINTRNQLERAEGNRGDLTEKFIKQIDTIVQHPKVSDLHLVDGIFKVFIPEVYAYDKNNKRYYIGNCHVTINIENTDVRFFGDNKRGSYWGRTDPHPHVNGRSGEACLGNISSTIAELCSRNEIYALVLTAIDFLENVNIDDPAGRCVRFWDEVNESGEVINEGQEYDRDR